MTALSAERCTSFWAQTCIEPDRIAHLVRDLSEQVQGGFTRAYIRFEGATPGRLSFSVRTRVARIQLMTFDVVIGRLDGGLTSVCVAVGERLAHNRLAALAAAVTRPLGHETYKRYATDLAGALTRFDPMSTAVLLERVPR